MRYSKLCLIFLIWHSFVTPAFSCEVLNKSYLPVGKIISVNNGTEGNFAHLGSMLGARYARKVGDPKIQSLLLRIDQQTQKLKIINELEQGLEGPIYEYDVACVNGSWVYSDRGITGAEGVSREYEVTVRLKALQNGDVEVSNQRIITRGTFLKSKSTISVIAHFQTRTK